MRSNAEAVKKSYSSPKLTRLTSEQAKLLLIGHATQGDPGARDLLGLIYPATGEQSEKVSPLHSEEQPGGVVTQNTPKPPGLFFVLWPFQNYSARIFAGCFIDQHSGNAAGKEITCESGTLSRPSLATWRNISSTPAPQAAAEESSKG